MNQTISYCRRIILAVEAYLLLVTADLAIHLTSFDKLHKLLSGIKSRRADRQIEIGRPTEGSEVRDVCRAVEAATRYYYRVRKDCLPKSLVVYYLLIRRAIPAELCIGFQKRPFIAHAWVEYRGAVLTDSAEKTKAYLVLLRA